MGAEGKMVQGWKQDKDSMADCLLLIAFNEQRQAEIVRAYRKREKGVEIHLEKHRPGHKGSCVLCEKAELKV